jgi:cation diffusion facilitator CzcD-associated flavoprotein CzcO
MTLHVAVVGAGLGGLTLVRLIEHRKLPIKLSVFEADASPNVRSSQGGSLDLKVSLSYSHSFIPLTISLARVRTESYERSRPL